MTLFKTPRRRYAGVSKFAVRSEGYVWCEPPKHTPAHRTEEQIMALPPCERRVARANEHVDLQAKKAAEIHPAPTN